MEKVVWIIQGILAAFFIRPGIVKLITPKAILVEKNHIGADDAIIPIRIIGSMEILGIIGIIIPHLIGVLPVLTPIAAIGFCIVMCGAFVVKYKKKQYKFLPLFVLVFILSAIVVWYRL